MKNIFKLFILSFIISFSSCEDFLDKTPLDQVTEAEYYSTPEELRVAVNTLYSDLPSWANAGTGSSALPDNGTDLVMNQTPADRLLGIYNIPTASTASIWSWDEIREVNWFLDHTGQASGDQTDIDQYTGEGYFFRAYHYFKLLVDYGDVPIFPEYFDNSDETYVFASRDPRNEVADFILADLDTAISLLKSFPDLGDWPRISKEAAQLLKARVALFEGTWEKYHSGTDFGVTGSDGTSYLGIAVDASESIIDSGVFSLHDDYETLFNTSGLIGNSEMILWRDYDYANLSIGNDLQVSWPNGCSYSRFAVRSYLCTDGDPISVSPLYVGDQDLSTIETNRDPRLAATIMVPGDITRLDNGTYTYWTVPFLGNAQGGYESQKYRDYNTYADQANGYTRSTSKIAMRYAEALLIFAEAKAELGTITQADLSKSVNLLRARVGMPNMSISPTTDPDWPNYGYTLTPILQEIRRERSVELMAEGYRLNDLLRWRAHELINGDTPLGAYYYDGIVENGVGTTTILLDEDDYLDPYQVFMAFDFDETKAYLKPLPLDELSLNPNLTQNPGWE
ncbi:RagB/SusD family nutrient uptake outer membrane protein [Seonamhaeicola sp. MEBiC1930]|uniref:RagB/SusD family nutrient uptake outer membrane protein n=1 Tax=Seonamhaeicola sp. MEBiC01930 TaxID=2976768 RepID=UPI00324EB16C